MGAHHAETAEAPTLARATRGALVASTVLALFGAGAGLALATPEHGGGLGSGHGSGHGHGHGNGNGDGNGNGNENENDERSSDQSCDTGTRGVTGGLLGELGLTSSPKQLCDTSGSSGSGAASTDPGSSDAQSAAPAQPAPARPAPARPVVRPTAPSGSTNPEDIPPVLGQTKVIQLPKHPAGQTKVIQLRKHPAGRA